MLSDFTGAGKVYICSGYTDIRQRIDRLSALVRQDFDLDPFSNTMFLFCGRCRDIIKALYWEGGQRFVVAVVGYVVAESLNLWTGRRIVHLNRAA